jgi:hypothetical protein
MIIANPGTAQPLLIQYKLPRLGFGDPKESASRTGNAVIGTPIQV